MSPPVAIGTPDSGLAPPLPHARGQRSAGVAQAGTPALASMRPQLRLFTERMAVNQGDVFDPSFEELELPALSLGFGYGADVVRASDKRATVGTRVRDRALEDRARRLLESFGPLDLACLIK